MSTFISAETGQKWAKRKPPGNGGDLSGYTQTSGRL